MELLPTVMESSVTVIPFCVSLTPTSCVRLSIRASCSWLMSLSVLSCHSMANQSRSVRGIPTAARVVPASTRTNAAAIRAPFGILRLRAVDCCCFIISKTSFRSVTGAWIWSKVSR